MMGGMWVFGCLAEAEVWLGTGAGALGGPGFCWAAGWPKESGTNSFNLGLPPYYSLQQNE